MPYPNKHVAILKDKANYDQSTYRPLVNLYGDGIDGLYAKNTVTGKWDMIEILFDSAKISEAQAHEWLKKHGTEPLVFYPAGAEASAEPEIPPVITRWDGTFALLAANTPEDPVCYIADVFPLDTEITLGDGRKFIIDTETLNTILANYETMSEYGITPPFTADHVDSDDLTKNTIGKVIDIFAEDGRLKATVTLLGWQWKDKIEAGLVNKVSIGVEMTDRILEDGSVITAPYLSHIALTVDPQVAKQKPLTIIADAGKKLFNSITSRLTKKEEAAQMAFTPEEETRVKALEDGLKAIMAKLDEMGGTVAAAQETAKTAAVEASAMRTRSITDSVDALVKTGAIAPAEKDGIVAQLGKLDDEGRKIILASYSTKKTETAITGKAMPKATDSLTDEDYKAFYAAHKNEITGGEDAVMKFKSRWTDSVLEFKGQVR